MNYARTMFTPTMFSRRRGSRPWHVGGRDQSDDDVQVCWAFGFGFCRPSPSRWECNYDLGHEEVQENHRHNLKPRIWNIWQYCADKNANNMCLVMLCMPPPTLKAWQWCGKYILSRERGCSLGDKYMHVYTYIYIYIHICIYVHICYRVYSIHIYIYIYIYMCIHICMYIYIYIYIYVR